MLWFNILKIKYSYDTVYNKDKLYLQYNVVYLPETSGWFTGLERVKIK